jgi:hypothetical protein
LQATADSRLGEPQLVRRFLVRTSIERNVFWFFLSVDLALIFLFLGLYLSGHYIDVMAIGLERSIPNWYSTVKLLILAQLLALFAWRTPVATWRGYAILLAPAALFLLLSVEEVVGIHGRVERRILPRFADGSATAAQGGNLWPLLFGLPLGLVLIATGIVFARIVRPAWRTVAKASAGAALFLAGAVGVEILFDGPGEHTIRVLPAAAGEGGELVGISLMIWAALDLLRPFVWADPANAMRRP